MNEVDKTASYIAQKWAEKRAKEILADMDWLFIMAPSMNYQDISHEVWSQAIEQEGQLSPLPFHGIVKVWYRVALSAFLSEGVEGWLLDNPHPVAGIIRKPKDYARF